MSKVARCLQAVRLLILYLQNWLFIFVRVLTRIACSWREFAIHFKTNTKICEFASIEMNNSTGVIIFHRLNLNTGIFQNNLLRLWVKWSTWRWILIQNLDCNPVLTENLYVYIMTKLSISNNELSRLKNWWCFLIRVFFLTVRF